MESFKMNRGIAGVCAALLMCSGAALGQDQGGDFSQPLNTSGKGAKASGGPGKGWGGGENRVMLKSSEENGDTYEITIVNGDIDAKLNGKAIPAERIRRSKDKVEILDEHGKTLKSFDVAFGDGGVGGGMGGNRAHGRLLRRSEPAIPAEPFQPMEPLNAIQPKVMIGITMGEPSEALAGHLGIKQDEAVVVERVFEGLPADKAGLKVQDIIIEVDDVHPVTQQNFRETINKKNPGDKVQLKVLRKGEEQKLTIELQKFDGEKFGMKVPGGAGGGVGGGAGGGWNADQFREAFKDNPDLQKHFEEAMRNGWKGNPDGPGQAWVFGNGPDGAFKFTPFGGADSKRLDEMQTQLDKKIAELDEKLARINEQMERLEKLLSKMSEKGTR